MIRIASAASASSQSDIAATNCVEQLLADHLDGPDYLMIQADARHDLSVVAGIIRARWPETHLHAVTSCLGSFTEAGLYMGPEPGVCMFAISDTDGDFGTACGELGDSPRAAAAALARAALIDADRLGESPALVWISSAPGSEEEVIAGIQEVVGAATPIVGGSAADNSIAGDWRMTSGGLTVANGLVLSVLFPSGKIGAAFHSGYTPTAQRGRITRCEGRRIDEIDGRPAATVYSEWTGDAVRAPATGVENVLMSTTLWPLGRAMQTLGGTDVHILSHPETIAANGAMTLFTRVEQGEELILMSGTIDALVQRPVLVAQSASRVGEIETADIAGMILVFCAGCMLTVKERMDEVRASLAEALPGVPIIAAFTFGEQGPVFTCQNRHGNLMISAVVIARS